MNSAPPLILLRADNVPPCSLTIPAEIALKYGAELIPAYSIRQPNGLDFEVVMMEPIPHSDPETMTQALNDSLAARVKEHPEQWFWVHRRWRSHMP